MVEPISENSGGKNVSVSPKFFLFVAGVVKYLREFS
jgi:hypothetical protein